jgi:hypothetical protein
MSLPITLAALENRVVSVGASLCAADDPREVAADLVGLRGEIGTFLDRHGIDITDEVWANLISAMERIDGTIAYMRRAGIRFA